MPSKGARAVLRLYAENMDQSEMIMTFARRAGFAGGVVVDWPHSSKARKAYLVLTCGPPSLTSLPKGKDEDGEMCSNGDESNDNKTQTGGEVIYMTKELEEQQKDKWKASCRFRWTSLKKLAMSLDSLLFSVGRIK